MQDNPQLQYITDIKGNISSVIIPWPLWEKMETQGSQHFGSRRKAARTRTGRRPAGKF